MQETTTAPRRSNANRSQRVALRGSAALAAALLAGGVQAAHNCEQPLMPTLPDGAKATMEEMLEGQKSVKAFQASNMSYMKCLEEHFQAAESNAKNAPDAADRAVAREEYEGAIDAYNAAVSAEEEVAGQFNVELREYKAANKDKWWLSYL